MTSPIGFTLLSSTLRREARRNDVARNRRTRLLDEEIGELPGILDVQRATGPLVEPVDVG